MPAARRYALARAAIAIALVVYTALVLGANGARDVPFSQISQAMAGAPGVAALSVRDANAVQDVFGLDADALSGWLYYAGDSVMDVAELFIAQSPDEAALDRAEAAATARLEAQTESFRNYGTDQIDLLEHAIVLRRGGYVFYGVSESVEQWEARFLSCVR